MSLNLTPDEILSWPGKPPVDASYLVGNDYPVGHPSEDDE